MDPPGYIDDGYSTEEYDEEEEMYNEMENLTKSVIQNVRSLDTDIDNYRLGIDISSAILNVEQIQDDKDVDTEDIGVYVELIDDFKAQDVKKRTKKKRVPPHIQKLLGDANKAFTDGDFDKALTLLGKIVQEAPTMSEPYATMALIFEEQDKKVESLQFNIIAAHLTKDKDEERWKTLISMATDLEDYNSLLVCLDKFINITKDLSLKEMALWSRVETLDQLNREYSKIYTLKHIVKLFPNNEEAITSLGMILFGKGKYKMIVEILSEIIENWKIAVQSRSTEVLPTNGLHNVLNMLCEVLNAQEQYTKIIENLEAVVIVQSGIDTSKQMTQGVPPEISKSTLPIELYAYLAGAHCLMGSSEHIFLLLNDPVDPSYSDVFLRLAHICFDCHLFDEALYICEGLVSTVKSDELLILFADIFEQMNRVEEAIQRLREAYDISHSSTIRLRLIHLLEMMSVEIDSDLLQFKDISDLQGSEKSAEVDFRIQRLNRMESSDIDEFAILTTELLRIASDNTIADQVSRNFALTRLSHIVNKVVKYYFEQDDLYSAVNTLTYFLEANLGEKYLKLKVHHLRACLAFQNQSFMEAYNSARFLVSSYERPIGWALIQRTLLHCSEPSSHLRFLIRNYAAINDKRKKETKTALQDLLYSTLIGHHCLHTGTYALGVKSYLQALNYPGKEPLLFLCLSVALLNYSTRRTTKSDLRIKMMLTGLSFLSLYQVNRKRNNEQEVLFNFGRFFHHLKFNWVAEHFYKKALKVNPNCGSDLDLTFDIAHNLSNLYFSQGQKEMAFYIMSEYLQLPSVM
eukprot:TRINITY_DN2814_c0_g1_i1.p1 TRINITY_DN2814_c0_g1~~TRINITY_DN2814_c0_g1_i1.p1  ORF type:complete len:802 (-),score=176.22 TRINITY_DN2814_c0_g1_i1:2-2407(-)